MTQTATTSIRINPETWGKFRIYCIKKKTNSSKMLQQLIEKELSKSS